MRLAILCAAAALVSLAAFSQAPQDLPHSRTATPRLADTTKTRFTDHKLTRTTNTEPDGAVIYSSTELFEETWINNLPYQRLLQLDGEPLTGQRARDEQQRYDAAISGRQPLGTDQRIRLNQADPVGIDADPLQALTAAYTLRELPAQGDLRVFVAEPYGLPPGRCPWRYTLWIAPSPEAFLVRYRADIPTPASEACNGIWQETTYTLVDGVPKPTHIHAHFFQLEGHDRITIDGDDTFTDYRRFTTHITIGPATIAPSPTR